MSRGFQAGAFQRGAFQQPEAVGSGGWIVEWLNFARRKAKERAIDEEAKRKKKKRVPETVELSFRAIAPQAIAPLMVRLIGSRALDEAAELAEYAAVIKLIDAMEEA